MKRTKTGLILILLGLLCGCDFSSHRDYHDPALKLQKEDYEKITKPPCEQIAPPSFCPKAPCPPKTPPLTPAMRKKLSLSLQETIPLKSAFIEIGRQAGVGIVLSPKMTQENMAMVYEVREGMFIDIIGDLCVLTNHRYQIQENRLLIEPDDPYLVTYNLQFLSHSRKSENRITISTDLFSPMEGQKRHDNGSMSTLLGNSHMDFWSELEQNLKILLSSKENPYYSLHRQAGLLTIFGSAKTHKHIIDYLAKLKESIASQVIIEAKIIEVTLDNEYKTGINWSHLGETLQVGAPLGSLTTPGGLSPSQLLSRDMLTFSVGLGDFSTVINLVKKFGTVRTLSNPRLTVMNNQPALLKVATNEVFFHLEFERYFQADGKPDIENISSDAMTVPIGLVMIVQPSINLQTGEILMTLRPTISRVEKEVADPAVAIKSHQKVTSTIPVIQVRELDSVLKMKSGQVLVMGGLMEDRSSYQTTSIPGIDDIPILGELMSGKEDERKTTELVIFLTAHIVEDPFVCEADERVYNTYTEDPRPLF